MTIKDVVQSARQIDALNACITRAELFSGIGKDDPYGGAFAADSELVDVCSARGKSLLNIVKQEKHCNITQYNVIRQWVDNDKEIDDRLNGLEDLVSFGYVEKYVNPSTGVVSYEITFLSKRLCGARFTLCKELAHIMTDTTDGVETPDAMFKCAMKWMESIASSDAELDSETTGFYYAIELMIPWRLRSEFIKLSSDLKLTTKEDRDMKIAQCFMIPARVVGHICECREDANDLPYCGFSYRLNSQLAS